MSDDDAAQSKPMKELEWLAHYLGNHGRKDLAEKISKALQSLRNHKLITIQEDGNDPPNLPAQSKE